MSVSQPAAGLDSSRGHHAASPSQLTLQAWKEILWRVWEEFNQDRVTLIAAGATFYLILALFPALAAFVSIYGFVADPVTIADHIAFLGGLLPRPAVELIQAQLQSLVSEPRSSLSFGFLFGLALTLWSANNGIKALFEAMNIAYDETEKRSFIKLNAISLLFTFGALIIGVLFITLVGVVPAVLRFIGLGGFTETLISLLRWPVLFLVAALAISVLYRYGPSRTRAKWRWVTWGSFLATLFWIVASILFSWYLTNFANYNATYGSLGAAIGFMMWTWISVVILIAGAELNSEMEHQTARDSTVGEEKPLGARGATMADKVAGVVDESSGTERNGPAAAPERRRREAAGRGVRGIQGTDDRQAARVLQLTDQRPSTLAKAVAVAISAVAVGSHLFRGRRQPAPLSAGVVKRRRANG
jgi:membrane protein